MSKGSPTNRTAAANVKQALGADKGLLLSIMPACSGTRDSAALLFANVQQAVHAITVFLLSDLPAFIALALALGSFGPPCFAFT